MAEEETTGTSLATSLDGKLKSRRTPTQKRGPEKVRGRFGSLDEAKACRLGERRGDRIRRELGMAAASVGWAQARRPLLASPPKLLRT